MPSSTVFLASDVHLGAVPPSRERAFRRWLDRVGSEAGTLVLNGDLFDFWFEYRHAVPKGHTRVLGALADLVESGVEVHLTGGNHDWWGGTFLEDEIGLHFHRDPIELDLAGLRTWVAHGDGLGPGDGGYKVLKRVLRSRLFVWAFRWLHPDLGARVAGGVSLTEGRAKGPSSHEVERAGILEAWALDQLAARPEVDLLTLGHTHVPRLTGAAPGRWYLNTGDWVHHCTYAVIEPGQAPRLMQWADGDAVPFAGSTRPT